jgi:hypothetical protein
MVSVIMFSGANVRVLGFLPDLQGWVLSGSSQSTLCAVGRRCSCRQGSSHGSLNGSSPLATWDLLYEVAGEVERTIGFEPVWKGKKPNRTEPKLIGLNRFSVRFGSKNFKKIIRFGCLFWFKTGPNRKCSALWATTHSLPMVGRSLTL